ncbi:MAG TPA: DUF2798 domain-containing protein [Noviherbaspirillum sp.]|nr:DUF2798 domain-containing protein [Noviherbaspirillum sp.]
MIPEKYVPVLFGAILSGLMSLLVSGISTLRTIGPATSFLHIWLGAWLAAWLVAFPVVLLVAPLTRKVVQRLTAKN